MHPHPNHREKFPLLIDVPIQDHAQQIEIHEVFKLDVLHGNYSLHYDIEDKYLGITFGETSAIEISENQFQICKKANGQFCFTKHTIVITCQPTNMFIISLHQRQE